MTEPWIAEVEVRAGEAERLIDRQFPELAPAAAVRLGEGWDNTAYLVHGRWVFRFPRRQIAAGLILNEVRALQSLSGRLPLPAPVPEYLGLPEHAAFPYHFTGYRMIPGTEAARYAWTDAGRSAAAVPLARFLSSLHGAPMSAADLEWAPRDTLRRTDMQYRLPMLAERLERIAEMTPEVDTALALRIAAEAAQAPPFAAEPVWVHGDLHSRHILVDPTGAPCGIIDWGDVHLGDPALDLSIAFTFLPPTARATFRRRYGPIDEATWRRARFRAIHYGAIITLYGEGVADADIRAAGEYALRHAVEGE